MASKAPAANRFKTVVGTGTNARLDAAKGPFVKDIESAVHNLADAMVATKQRLSDANGPIPALQETLPPERIAALHLPEWFVRGNQHPTSPAAQDYWGKRVAMPSPSSPAAAGPNGARLFQQQMVQMWQNPKYRAIAFESMPPEMRQELVQAVQSGIHPGYAVTLQDGKVIRVPEDGSINDHTGGQ